MDRRVTTVPLDPAVAVSGLLTRLGLFLLVVVTPVLAMISRRGVSILVPIATVLLILAAALDGRLPAALSRFGQSVTSRRALSLIALLLWAAITILWTPNRMAAAARLPSIVVTVALFTGAIACLRPSVRLSDVNLIPLGVALAALALAVEFIPDTRLAALTDASPSSVESERAAMLLCLLVWPGVGSLASKGRTWQALVLALAVIGALWLVHSLVVVAAYGAGAFAYLVGTLRPRTGTVAIGSAILALLILAPGIGWLMAGHGGFLLPSEGDTLVAVWRDVTYSLPTHFVQGFGFDASRSLTRGVGGVLLQSPQNAALQIWLELGLVGVALASVAVIVVVSAIEKADPKARPAALAVCAAAAVMMFAGLAAWQTWWLTALGLTAISLAFVSRRAARVR